MKILALFAFPLLIACAGQIPHSVELQPQAENVEFAYEPPSSDAYKEIGHVTGQALGKDPDATLEQAKNDLRNKAAALGAALVTIDDNEGALVPLTEETKVTLSGRAYKPAD